SPPSRWEPVDAAIAELGSYDWLVFSSANGVQYFFDRLLELDCDLRAVGRCQLATIGPATAATLARFHLRSDLKPDEYRAEALAMQLAARATGKRVLLVRASRGR